jgi:hypothetical protein
MPQMEASTNSYMIRPNDTVAFSPEEMFKRSIQQTVDNDDDEEWR